MYCAIMALISVSMYDLNLYLYTRYAPPAATASPKIMTKTAVHADLTSVTAFLLMQVSWSLMYSRSPLQVHS
nr:hypothetical protein Iba_chr04aCG2010 [Ipomoea batatas]GMC89581.1 hypothetical protein Iba_chr04fCG0220 [Ipomoea batatas]